MKKHGIFILVIMTLLFTGFILGFFIGRNISHGEIQISRQPDRTTASQATDSSIPATQSATEQIGDTNPTQNSATSGKININTATKEQLMSLDGIGEVLAQNIIDYRTTNGPFKKPTDLLLVDGIGEKRLDAILDKITT